MYTMKVLGPGGSKTANLYKAIEPAQPATRDVCIIWTGSNRAGVYNGMNLAKEKLWQFINKTLVKKVNKSKSDISNNTSLNGGASYLKKLLSRNGVH